MYSTESCLKVSYCFTDTIRKKISVGCVAVEAQQLHIPISFQSVLSDT